MSQKIMEFIMDFQVREHVIKRWDIYEFFLCTYNVLTLYKLKSLSPHAKHFCKIANIGAKK